MVDRKLLEDNSRFTGALYKQLSSLGWHMPGTSETQFLLEIYLLLKKNKIGSVDKKMAEFIESNIRIYQYHITHKLSSRKIIFTQILKAHKQRQYYLTIPAIYSQLDGICEEYFGYCLFKTKNGVPSISNYIKTFNNEFLEMLLSSFSNISEQNRLQSKRNISGSNRHDILHGTSTNYGTRINSCKALSLLFDVVDLLSLKDS